MDYGTANVYGELSLSGALSLNLDSVNYMVSRKCGVPLVGLAQHSRKQSRPSQCVLEVLGVQTCLQCPRLVLLFAATTGR